MKSPCSLHGVNTFIARGDIVTICRENDKFTVLEVRTNETLLETTSGRRMVWSTPEIFQKVAAGEYSLTHPDMG
jgi:hypothetical protein